MTEYRTTVYEDDMCIVRVHKPILTAEEYKVREQNVKKALAEFGKALINKGVCR
jgi:hypothetical protein